MRLNVTDAFDLRHAKLSNLPHEFRGKAERPHLDGAAQTAGRLTDGTDPHLTSDSKGAPSAVRSTLFLTRGIRRQPRPGSP